MLNFSTRIKKYLSEQFNLPEDQVELMLPEFKKTLKDHMAALEDVQNHNNLKDLGKAAHTIKGAFLNLGLQDCAELAMKVEDNATLGNMQTDYTALIASIREKVQEIINE